MRDLELLAPGGDLEAIKAAMLAGADAIYCGLDKFNARNRAANISVNDLHGILREAHKRDCQVFITLNILLLDNEIKPLISLLNKLYRMPIDGLIIQDIGLAYILNNYFPNFDIHASTQLTTHNEGQILFLKQLNASRVNLSRELSIAEIEQLSTVAHQHEMLTEVFVHGSQCISFSGACYFSSVYGGNSGNRGRCSQPCRSQYELSNNTQSYIFNLKDNSAIHHIDALIDAGADSLKIEGRIKKADYVSTVVDTYRKRIDGKLSSQKGEKNLYKVFNRDFTTGFLEAKNGPDMFISSPRDHSLKHLQKRLSYKSEEQKQLNADQFFKDKDQKKQELANEITQLNFKKLKLKLQLRGGVGELLHITCFAGDAVFEYKSKCALRDKGQVVLSAELLSSRLNVLDEIPYILSDIDTAELSDGVYIPFKEINAFKKYLLEKLSGGHAINDDIILEKLSKSHVSDVNKKLSVLINDVNDIQDDNEVCYYFDMPNAMHHQLNNLLSVFRTHQQLIPYFPSILIGEDYSAALQFLEELKPHEIVTNNSGIANAAMELGIKWVAGPYFNVSNSYTILSLNDMKGCKGAFLSGEMNRQQIRYIKRPEGFELGFSIFIPVLLMTSRQCLIHEASKCSLSQMNATCLTQCNRTAEVKSEKGDIIEIKKSKGYHHRVFSDKHYLNIDVIDDCKDLFGNYMIDLCSIDKLEFKHKIINHFKQLISGDTSAKEWIQDEFTNVSNHQYKVGL